MDLSFPLLPAGVFGPEGGLLTALLIGFAFGFALERGGFGNARKLAAQFYLYDMTVFKVMFSAILTAMSGLYAFQALGWADLGQIWINPTFLGAQLVAGFLLGVGFILSGLCPGTGFVSLASGKLDALVAIGGIFAGTLLFGLGLEVWPWLQGLYLEPGTGRVLLPDLFGLPAPWLALGIVLMALGAFVGAERVEAIFVRRREGLNDPTDVRPVPDRRGKFALAGGLALVCLLAALAGPRSLQVAQAAAETSPTPIAPLELAEALIAREGNLLLVDLRGEAPAEGPRLPGAVPFDRGLPLPDWITAAAPGTRIVLLDDSAEAPPLPEGWPPVLDTRWLQGGVAAWQAEVLSPREPEAPTAAAHAAVARQRQLAAFFSGAAVSAAAAPPPPPPPAAAGGGVKKKAAGGC
jgi:hypothetical protein